MRVLIDVNCLLVSIPKRSKYRLVFDAFLQKRFIFIISNEILSEYTEIISAKTSSQIAINIAELLLISANIEKQEVYYRWNIIETDRDGNKYVDCAIASNADFIVSNDKHFNVLKKLVFPKVTVISLDEFVVLLE